MKHDRRLREEKIADAIVLACILAAVVFFFLMSDTVALDRLFSKG